MMRFWPCTCRKIVVFVCVLLNGSMVAATEPLVLEMKDFPIEQGLTRTYSFEAADGTLQGQLVDQIVESTLMGDTQVVRSIQNMDGKPIGSSKWMLRSDRVVVLNEKNQQTVFELDLPAREGQSKRFTRANLAAINLRVDRQEAITVPAGTFLCQVWVFEEESDPNQSAGIGAKLSGNANGLRVDSIAADSPVLAVGLTPGCVITDVDGVSIKGMPVEEAIKKIRGAAGSKAQLDFLDSTGRVRRENVIRSALPGNRSSLWIAPGVGVVRLEMPNRPPQVLTSFVRSSERSVADAGWAILSNFEDGALTSPLFPKAIWKGATGGADAISTVEIDATSAPVGSTKSLCWRYHSKNHTWITAEILPSGSWAEMADLSIYDKAVFQIKGFKPVNVGFLWRGRPPQGGDFTYAAIPVDVTTEWQKVEIDLNDPEWKKLDMSQVALISFFTWPEDMDSNVVWIDDVKFHVRNGSAAP